MSEEERISYLREKLGYETRKKGESAHDGASKEFLRGFGSNVTPKRFGAGQPIPDWECVCGHINTFKRRLRKGNEELCWSCNQPRDYVDLERIT